MRHVLPKGDKGGKRGANSFNRQTREESEHRWLYIRMLYDGGMPTTKIGKLLGITRERVRQLLLRSGSLHEERMDQVA